MIQHRTKKCVLSYRHCCPARNNCNCEDHDRLCFIRGPDTKRESLTSICLIKEGDVLLQHRPEDLTLNECVDATHGDVVDEVAHKLTDSTAGDAEMKTVRIDPRSSALSSPLAVLSGSPHDGDE